MEKGVLIRNEGQCKITFKGGEISPSEYKVVSAGTAALLLSYPFIKRVPTAEEVVAEQAGQTEQEGAKNDNAKPVVETEAKAETPEEETPARRGRKSASK